MQNARDHINLGLAFSSSNMFNDAIVEFRKAANITPDDPDVYFYMGQTYEKMGMLSEAVETYSKSVQCNQAHADSIAALARLTAQSSDDNTDFLSLEQASKMAPDVSEAALKLAYGYLKKGRNDEAVMEFEKIIANEPSNQEAAFNLGVLLTARDPDRALQLFALVSRNDLNFAKSSYHAAVIHEARKEPGKAEALYLQAIETDVSMAPAYNNLGGIYYRKGDLTAAANYYVKATQLDPENANIHNNCGRVFYRLGNLDRAFEEYNMAVKLNSSLAGAHYNIGLIYIKKGNYPKAIESFETVKKLKPKLADVYGKLGAIHYMAGRLDKAVEEFSLNIKLNPKAVDAMAKLGNIALKNRDFKGAESWWRQALEIDPGNSVIAKNLENLHNAG